MFMILRFVVQGLGFRQSYYRERGGARERDRDIERETERERERQRYILREGKRDIQRE